MAEMARILVTGVSGFVGKHLTRELHKRDHEIYGAGISEQPNESIKHLLSSYIAADLTDNGQVSKIPLERIDGVISLAGLAQVGASFKDPESYYKVNVEVLSILAERVIKEKPDIKVLAVSTGAVYDNRQELPFTEDSKLSEESSPYAKSKILMEQRAAELREKGLACVIVRPFNHIGPGQEPGFLVPDLYSKIQQSLSTDAPVLVGNLKTRRDYTDVRDVVRAYADLINLPEWEHDVYNVCSGKSIPGETILELLLQASGANGKVKIEADKSLIRPNDPPELYGSHERLSKETGWQPGIKVEQTIEDFVKNQEG
jgi:GDP-4-dehydro-6-deoxy-D-mannose reductase